MDKLVPAFLKGEKGPKNKWVEKEIQVIIDNNLIQGNTKSRYEMCQSSSKESGFKGNTYPHCNFCWGFNNSNYQTNSHRYCSSNKQTQQIKLYTYHLASVYPLPLKSEHLIVFEDICIL